MNMNIETLARMIVFVPLAFATYQVSMLSRVLTSMAWRFLMLGFMTFAVLSAIVMFTALPILVRLGASLLGYTFIVAGLHFLRDDLNRITGGRRVTGTPKEKKIMQTITVFAKAAWKSKTVIVNVLAATLALADVATQFHLSIVTEPWFVPSLAAINVVLRFLTDQPVALKEGTPKEVKRGTEGV